MIIPLWVDENKDKALIEWLDSEQNRSPIVRNRSQAIRQHLYNCMNGKLEYKQIVIEKETEIDNDFMNSLNSFSFGDE